MQLHRRTYSYLCEKIRQVRMNFRSQRRSSHIDEKISVDVRLHLDFIQHFQRLVLGDFKTFRHQTWMQTLQKLFAFCLYTGQ